MIHKLADIIAKRWLNRNIITNEFYNYYVYGLETILLGIMGIINILVISLITNTLNRAVCFLLTFIIIREFTGGYHADTPLKCNLLFSIVYLLNLYLSDSYHGNLISFIFIILVVGLIIIYRIGPVENKHKKLSLQQKKINKRYSIYTYVICCAVSFALARSHPYLAITICIALCEVLLLMVIGSGLIKEKAAESCD